MNTARDMACDHLNCPASYPRSTAPHSVECDKLTAAIEADRSQRTGLDPARALEVLDSLAAEIEEARLYEIPGGQKVSRTPRWCGLGPGKRQLLNRFIADMREALTSQPGGERK